MRRKRGTHQTGLREREKVRERKKKKQAQKRTKPPLESIEPKWRKKEGPKLM